MRSMTPQEVATAAAQAVATAEAKEAARVADAENTDVEAAQAFVDSAMKALKEIATPRMVSFIRGKFSRESKEIA
ncbi:unnamed protein product [Ilex paraguariensis]|uniref:Uncharacterized protein n=1 Tax=Ilex paraguariensis TaxID=185542 RepID=A0ABC8QLJ8_9AQUA